MTTHLHVHLEPNERKRRQLGRARQSYSNAEEFFAEHSLDNPERLPVSLSDLGYFIRELHAEQYSEGVSYVEMRLSPRRFLSPATPLSAVLEEASQAASALADPVLKLILLVNRDSSGELVDMCEAAIADGLPLSFVGVDLAGDEIRFPDVTRFANCFRAARLAGLGVTVHAGEFGSEDGIWDAIEKLGAQRIGHGVSIAGHYELARRLSADGVLVESSVTSNIGLGAVRSLDAHPLPWLLENGVPVCLNTDVPLHLGTKLADERELASVLLGGDSAALVSMEEAAREHRFRGPPAA